MEISVTELKNRLEIMIQSMNQSGLDGYIIYSDEYRSGNVTYFTNYKPINVIEESPQLLVLIKGLEPIVFIGRLNSYAAKNKIWIDDIFRIDKIDEILSQHISNLPKRNLNIGIIGNNLLPIKLFNLIQSIFIETKFVDSNQIILDQRKIKSEHEVALMSEAAQINDRILEQVIDKCTVGMTEIELAAEVEYIGRKLGADLGSATVIMAGNNTNYPAWRPSETRIEKGDFVMIDFNPSIGHYCNDGGITVVMPGANNAKQKALISGHKIIKEIVPKIKPYVSAQTIHDMMLEKLDPLGYGKNFSPYVKGTRGVGHGVGLDVVEFPDLNSSSDFILEPGMPLAIKLDLHNLDGTGFRIEVVNLITEEGSRPLNNLIFNKDDDFTILN